MENTRPLVRYNSDIEFPCSGVRFSEVVRVLGFLEEGKIKSSVGFDALLRILYTLSN